MWKIIFILDFNEFLPEIQEAINDCLFVSIDSELTGLNTVPNSINTFDTPAQYYTKFRKCCKEFLVIQYGLSIFKYILIFLNYLHKNVYCFSDMINLLINLNKGLIIFLYLDDQLIEIYLIKDFYAKQQVSIF